ncbi:MAG: mannose-6-phosphate isomerase, partial [Myxococcota bacterium]
MTTIRAAIPVKLAVDNFTPPKRTPWGGHRIVNVLKRHLDCDTAGSVVGESWELSVDPAFPSRLAGSDETLAARIAADPAGWLGRHVEDGGTPILVKLLDTADRLSVQVHPADDYPGLAPGESGKPECWYVLHAEPGAGLYLGLADGVTQETLAKALATGDEVESLLHFVHCDVGDCFVIGPGTVHAIGAGLTLVEPQLVQPGLSGKTYRLWDWGRRYRADGTQDPAGSPRQLHVRDSLAVIDFEAPRAEAFVASRRVQRALLQSSGDVRHERLCELEMLNVERLSGTGEITIPAVETLAGILVTRGGCVIETSHGALASTMGESVALPANVGAFRVQLENAEAVFTYLR